MKRDGRSESENFALSQCAHNERTTQLRCAIVLSVTTAGLLRRVQLESIISKVCGSWMAYFIYTTLIPTPPDTYYLFPTVSPLHCSDLLHSLTFVWAPDGVGPLSVLSPHFLLLPSGLIVSCTRAPPLLRIQPLLFQTFGLDSEYISLSPIAPLISSLVSYLTLDSVLSLLSIFLLPPGFSPLNGIFLSRSQWNVLSSAAEYALI